MIKNPVLPGFNPDPSFLRVGEDYYLATSTFEWYPGVQIHHSRDLQNWSLVSRPLNRAALLDMRGNPDSCGVWAPCLSWADGIFWLVYTDIKRLDGAFKDSPNYITTCSTIDGHWSDPIYVNSSGFDPSLYHDDSGKKYFLNMQWNHRGEGTGGNPKHASFDGILLQEWNPASGLTGPVTNIYSGTERGLVEAPHLFKRNNWYYLTVAEGGTGYRHAVTMARSRNITGPYETHPELHVLDASNHPEHPIQRTGHGQYVETHWGDVYHSFLMGRPLPGRYCPMGRETGLERCVWRDDNWLYLENKTALAREWVPLPGSPEDSSTPCPTFSEASFKPSESVKRLFDTDELPPEFQWLRTPFPERLFRLGEGALTLIGRESIGSWFEQSLVARRQEHHHYQAETTLRFDPKCYQQGAGLTTYYNRYKFHALVVTDEPDFGRSLQLLSCTGDYPDGALTFPLEEPVKLAAGEVSLRVAVSGKTQQFYYKIANEWQAVGPELDASCISDEGGRGEHASFTGAFCGMVAFDLTGQGKEARFSQFSYCPQN